MNTEATQEKSAVPSTGERLRLARESKGLTQQNVAERLCLKVSTVRDIEEDNSPTDLAATFLRGYIRSYARLVNVPEDDILPMLSKQAPVRSAKITPMHNISLGSSSRRKKRDGMLTTFTVLVILVVVGLTVAWWWQNHKASQADMAAMTDSASEVSSGGGNEQSIPLSADDSSATGSTPVPLDTENTAPAAPENTPAPAAETPAPPQTPAQPVAVSPSQTSLPASPPAVAQAPQAPDTTASAPATAAADTTAASSDALVMNFNGDCWLEVTDVTGRKLFSGLQRKGSSLNLKGKTPYRLKIGAPSAVSVQFRGQPVDLNRFIRNNQVARLTVGA
ncbi:MULTISPECIES: cytoskeleton protein RodZ [unclassified Tatumella]|uniref:cytoskeleton protein RodZ n=1 Tax=unclassified Tatumella TaxID=2649542 RepID=UPI001BB0261C|nr:MULTISPECIES: cytoskeleton protein RodZ [unclassified Tatumella]MBS0878231.1 cytoskeleton protein RodZ [Tatumella sp. JGM82]MBS0891681.1 cytoskeleton protein RodZ [Tatumella sp. JGM94]MBS0902907.1 cytoskeleton protein RodZ [Tatumella sp. JGM100]